MDWDQINLIRTRFIMWKMGRENQIGTIEDGDGTLVAINHAPSVMYFSVRDPVIRISYVRPGRTMLKEMIQAWIKKSREAEEMPGDPVPVFPKIFRGVPVRYYRAPSRPVEARTLRERLHDRDFVTPARQETVNALIGLFEEEFWNGQPGIIGRATGPVTICSVSGYGLNPDRTAPAIQVVCVKSDHPASSVTLDFPRKYHGVAVEYRSAFDWKEL